MQNTRLSGRLELLIIKPEALVTEIEILRLVFIPATIIDKEIAKTKASFLAWQAIGT